MVRNQVEPKAFNEDALLPYELRLQDFEIGMQDLYDFFFDVNSHLTEKGRRNPRGALGTRTATLDKDGVRKLRTNWIYRLKPS